MGEVTRVLAAIDDGDTAAADQLLPLVYSELRHLAAKRLAQERPGQTLQATALVHEAYVRLVDGAPEKQWNGRRHFFAAAAEAIRRILVENARRKNAIKRGGELRRARLDAVEAIFDADPDDLIALNEAVERLVQDDPEAANIAKLRLFAGLSVDDAAEALGVSRATAFRHWTVARAWLNAQLNNDNEMSS